MRLRLLCSGSLHILQFAMPALPVRTALGVPNDRPTSSLNTRTEPMRGCERQG